MLPSEMGSKKLKRKKYSKLEKVRNLRAVKRKKRGAFQINPEKKSERSLHPEKVALDRSRNKSCSLSCDESENVPEVKNFSKIREDYFIYLQTVISDNCAFYDSVVTEETLKNLALELEQNALLACLQIDIYKKSMCKIIRDIKKSTEEKQVHEEVRKLLPESVQEKSDNIKTDKSLAVFSEVEGYSRIPTIASIRTENDSMSDTNFWAEQAGYNSDPYYLLSSQDVYNKDQNVGSTAQPWSESETYSSKLDHRGYWNSEVTKTDQSNLVDLNNAQIVDDSQSSALQNSSSNLNEKGNISPKNFKENKMNCEKVDPLLLSRSHLQKLVEQTLNQTERIQRQKRDEQERAHIAHILEDDDSLDDRLNDSLSDNENESKENIDETNLMDRLEKMRELFGVEGEAPTDVVLEKPKPSNKVNNVSNCTHRPNNWRNEKFIQLHKYSLIAGEMTFERRHSNRKLFLKIFGDDSDEEHEMEYLSEEKYRSSCAERISSWVVKYLMPFYHDKRILGRSVFKTLGHHISDTIVDVIQYPDEWTVKYFVSKFFPPKMKYACDADVLNFQLD